MEASYLGREELAYELAIRGITGDLTAEVMQRTFRQLVKLERTSSFEAHPYPFTFAEDKAAIELKFTELSAKIDDFNDHRTSKAFKNLSTKICHLMGRINRAIPAQTADKAVCSSFLVNAVSLSSQLRVKAKQFSRAASTGNGAALHASALSGESSESTDDEGRRELSSRPLPLQNSVVVAAKVIPVSKWNLWYTGSNMSLSAFLELVEETRVARGVTKDLLLTSALDLFRDKALVWYRANRRSFSSWDELVQALRAEFQPHDYDDKLLDEVKRRTQGVNESIGIYVAVMSNLFSRFNVEIPEETQLKILRRNILPFYQTQLGLVEIASVGQLLKLGRQLEARKASVEAFVPPPPRNRTLEPDLAYVQTTAELASLQLPQPSISLRKCWNCGNSGHLSSRCDRPRRRHCYRCGKPNVTIATCSKCSLNYRRTQ